MIDKEPHFDNLGRITYIIALFPAYNLDATVRGCVAVTVLFKLVIQFGVGRISDSEAGGAA